jgi:hypothetical protein
VNCFTTLRVIYSDRSSSFKSSVGQGCDFSSVGKRTRENTLFANVANHQDQIIIIIIIIISSHNILIFIMNFII